MQGGRGGRDPFSDFGDPFAGFGGFGGFGGQRNLLSSFLGGRDPFDDPFFTRPFGSMFGPSMFGPTGSPFPNMPTGFIEHQVPQPNRSRGPIIEEINSDDENEGTKEKKENPRKHGRSSKEPYVVDPDDEGEGAVCFLIGSLLLTCYTMYFPVQSICVCCYLILSPYFLLQRERASLCIIGMITIG